MDGAVTTSRDRVGVVPARRPRLFSTAPGRRRYRRATDVLVLAPALLVLATLVALQPPSRFERSLSLFLASFPTWLDPLWRVLYDTLGLVAILLVLVALVGRRPLVWLQALASVAGAAAIAVLCARLALDRWPELDGVFRLHVGESSFPVLRLAVSSAIVLAIAPHLVRPLQSATRWIVLLGLVGALLVESASPSASLAAVLISVISASIVRLVAGTSAGQPEPDDVAELLREVGIDVERLDAADRQPAGAFVARGIDHDGRRLSVKVYGRDAYDTQLLEKLWRTALYAGNGPRARLTRLEAVEHEALVTLLAERAGVPTRGVVLAAETSSGDALVVAHDESRPVGDPSSGELDDQLLDGAWRAVLALGVAGIAHHRIDTETVVFFDNVIGIVDFDRGTVAASAEELEADRAQLLATTAALAGSETAVAAATRAIGVDGLTGLLPYLQPAAFGPSLRRALKTAELDVDELRASAAAAIGSDPPELVKLRRVTWFSLVQVALLAFAVSTVLGALAGLDYGSFADEIGAASWGWIAFGLVLAQTPRFTQAVSTPGLGARSPAFRPRVRDAARERLPQSRAAIGGGADGDQHPVLPAPRRAADDVGDRGGDRLVRRHGRPGAPAGGAAPLLQREPGLRPRGPLDPLAPHARHPRRDRSRRGRVALCRAPAARTDPRARAQLVAGRARDARQPQGGKQAGAPARRQPRDRAPLRHGPRRDRKRVRRRYRVGRAPADQHLGLAARDVRARARRHRCRRVRSHRRADGGRDGRGGGARGRRPLPDRDVLPPARVGVFRDALAPAKRPSLNHGGARKARGTIARHALDDRNQMPTVLQFDFPMPGPWGEEQVTAFKDLAEIIGRSPGLHWKIWTENEAEGIGGGIYLFEDDDSAQAYLEEHTARLEGFGITDIRAKLLHVNEQLSTLTRAPLALSP